jgi:hypothetical protein
MRNWHPQPFSSVVLPGSESRTLAGLRLIVEKLEQNRQSYDAAALAELTRILHRRIEELTGDPHPTESPEDDRRAELCQQP